MYKRQGSIEAIATEKGSVYQGLGEGGVAAINDDDPWADLWRAQSAGRKVLGFAFEQSADVTGRYQVRGLENRLTVFAQGEMCIRDSIVPAAVEKLAKSWGAQLDAAQFLSLIHI